ncbi:hypothetical protein SO802_033516 [Lithocarpus litseifolius]|uniref:RNase H type-1 domain-containing protein n=1 Tax=Lithocarpus litseifolius TaxID=425828 RepID=A0AAW2BDF3_9ROSI
MNLEIKSYSNFHIDAIITELENGFSWRYTGFYGYPETHLREESWKLISSLNRCYCLPWFYCGDFNEILSMNEKAGGAQRSQRQMEGFRQVINNCCFLDLGYCGPDFTWSNMKEGSQRISFRLDRAFATLEWLEFFKNPKVHHLAESTSDHCILAISNSSPQVYKGKRRFHFEAMWAKRDDCREIVASAWNLGSPSTTPEDISSNLQKCAIALTSWNQRVVGNIPKKIQEKRKLLNALTAKDQQGNLGVEINQLRKEINDLLDSEETMWHQRNKVHWYREGDQNTKFFHARASDRKKKNTILGLWNDDGQWCESKADIVATAVAYFEKIYTTTYPTRVNEVIGSIPRRVTEDMNLELTKTFTRDEKGTRWRVGNGRKIHIWEDKWLPTPTKFKIISPPSDFGDFPMVSSLIDKDTKWWKADVVYSLFLPFEANTILSILLSYNLPNDSLIWTGNKHGTFTIKSAYHIALSMVIPLGEGECSSSSSNSLIWKRIWHQKVPPKLKFFSWRICVNSLPTMENLSHRGIACSSFCPIYDKAIETTAHDIFHCDHAKLTWALWSDCLVDLSHPIRDPVDIVLGIMVRGTSHDMEIFFATAWSIWWNRNQVVHEDSGSPPSRSWEMANKTLIDFKDACFHPPLPQFPPALKWKAPPSGFFKINVDGATSNDGTNACIGVIVRDSQGLPIAVSSEILQSSYSAEIIEAFALLHGVRLALDLKLSHAIFESDALSIIQALNCGDADGEIGLILQDIKSCSASFSWCTFQHLKRDGNRVAQELAKAARLSGFTQIWKGVNPSCVEHLILDCLLYISFQLL